MASRLDKTWTLAGIRKRSNRCAVQQQQQKQEIEERQAKRKSAKGEKVGGRAQGQPQAEQPPMRIQPKAERKVPKPQEQQQTPAARNTTSMDHRRSRGVRITAVAKAKGRSRRSVSSEQ